MDPTICRMCHMPELTLPQPWPGELARAGAGEDPDRTVERGISTKR